MPWKFSHVPESTEGLVELCLPFLHVVVGIQDPQPKKPPTPHTHTQAGSSQWAGEERHLWPRGTSLEVRRGPMLGKSPPWKTPEMLKSLEAKAGIPQGKVSLARPLPLARLVLHTAHFINHFSRAIRQRAPARLVEAGDFSLSSLCFGWHLQLKGTRQALRCRVSMGLQLWPLETAPHSHSPDPFVPLASCYCSPLGDCITSIQLSDLSRPS